MSRRPTEEYAIIGWCITFVFGCITDVILVWRDSCLSEYFGIINTSWAECKSFQATAVAHTSFMNLGDAVVILSLTAVGVMVGGLYGMVKNRISK